MNKKTDLRIIRTQKAIREAFLELLNKKRYEQITIQDIAEKAVVNRNTFYLHYLDKDDLLAKLSSECLSELEKSLNLNIIEIKDEVRDNNLRSIIDNVLSTIERNFSFYQIMMSDSGIPRFTENFKEIIKNQITKTLKNIRQLRAHEKKQVEVCIEYVLSGMIGVFRFWFHNRSNYSIEEISDILFIIQSQNPLKVLI